jgi:hypothetical protein
MRVKSYLQKDKYTDVRSWMVTFSPSSGIGLYETSFFGIAPGCDAGERGYL